MNNNIFENVDPETIIKKALLVGLDTGEEADFDRSIDELKSLAEACGKKVVGIICQKASDVNKAWYIGTGKVAEVAEYAKDCEAEEVIFDNLLSPSQIRNLTKAIDLPVLDRNRLILDIFALRARTRESKIQVETARLKYMLPRLVGIHEGLSRQGGGSGALSNKGAGETKLELDRRHIEHRISELKRELEKVEDSRNTQMRLRDKSSVPKVSLVGYTNAGKSTIMNHILEMYGSEEDKKVLEKDILFATLDTSVRLIDKNDKRPFFLSDTVGFINKLPHDLVESFKSTLMEVKYSDLILCVVDYSDENFKEQMKVTADTLTELGAGDIPILYVYNKADRCNMDNLPKIYNDSIYISASNDEGIKELTELIQKLTYKDHREVTLLFPYSNGAEMSDFCNNAEVLSVDYLEEGVRVRGISGSKLIKKYDIFISKTN